MNHRLGVVSTGRDVSPSHSMIPAPRKVGSAGSPTDSRIVPAEVSQTAAVVDLRGGGGRTVLAR